MEMIHVLTWARISRPIAAPPRSYVDVPFGASVLEDVYLLSMDVEIPHVQPMHHRKTPSSSIKQSRDFLKSIEEPKVTI